ncbi:C40 family peptidase [Aquimarina brevivitae]|uniref:SH3 domain-containing protein n=1 Tax=Aquimarina brevivitae TaxID=323412 RepID=A0A4Q7P2S2_9FLAO|nr:C40 family peptidase [Aquimarina brevivitae]RZS93917.1 SH3 domain-containing protein [Aquimarina brevivitae]
MQYGICNLSIVPLRLEPSDPSEMVNQVLYGEHFKVLEQRKKWSRIRLAHDKYEGWIDNKQYVEIEESTYLAFNAQPPILAGDLIEYVDCEKHHLIPITLGASLNALSFFNHTYEGRKITETQPKEKLIGTSLLFLNAPYLWGGRTIFGIDCSGFTQMVYRLNGHSILRDASQQATQGEPLSFIEESEPGDLAFFDNEEGIITHVGIMMQDNHIIHASGKVRIDRIDHTGIYNAEMRTHTHKLRVIKRII